MTTKKPLITRTKTPIPIDESKLIQFIKGNDLAFYLNKISIRKAAIAAKKAGLGSCVKSLSERLKILQKEHASFWGMRKKPRVKGTDATSEYWESLKIIVTKNLDNLRGFPLDSVELIVRRWIHTNVYLLNGLPERLKVWEKKSNV